MKSLAAVTFIALVGIASTACATNGLISVKSPYPVGQTLDRLEAGTQQHGLKIFARIDHAAGATSIGKTLRPTELLIFGNPQGGTPLMECAQSAGIDLPLKALAYEDEGGQVWLAYNDPAFLARRHGIATCTAVEPIGKALSGLIAEAVSP